MVEFWNTLHPPVHILYDRSLTIYRYLKCTNLPSLTSESLLPSFSNSFAFFLKKLLKFTKSCKNEIYLQEIIKSRNVCSFYVVMQSLLMQILNWTNQCSLFMTVRYILTSARMGQPRTVTHARDY